MSFFDKVKELADAKKMSLAEVERKLGISENASYKWKKSTPKGEVVTKLADLFGVTTDYLYDREANNSAIEIASYFRKVTNDLEINEDEEKELEDDFKAYMEMRAALLKSKRKGK